LSADLRQLPEDSQRPACQLLCAHRLRVSPGQQGLSDCTNDCMLAVLTLERGSRQNAFPEPLSGENEQVFAYDCSQPLQPELVQVANGVEDCEAPPPEITSQRNTTVRILQKSERQTVKLHRCHVVKTTFPTMCGMHSHSSVLHSFLSFETTEEVTQQECQAMLESHEYLDLRGTLHELQRNRVNVILTMSAGASGESGHCQGGVAKLGTTDSPK
jgi:hypothetical protein